MRVGAKLQSENRKQMRKSLRCPAAVKWSDGTLTHTHTLDISSGGVSIAVPRPISGLGACHLAFVVLLPTGARNFMANCEITHCILSGVEGFRVGLRFLDLNADDRAQLEQVCQGHEQVPVKLKVFS